MSEAATNREVVRLGFDPDELEPGDELRWLFKSGGIALRFWGLYKRNHLTSQYYVPAGVKLAELVSGAEAREVRLYETPREFLNVLKKAGCPLPDDQWIIKHWDFFNPNIMRSVRFLYERTEPVEKEMVI